jgi:hypothetical protein
VAYGIQNPFAPGQSDYLDSMTGAMRTLARLEGPIPRARVLQALQLWSDPEAATVRVVARYLELYPGAVITDGNGVMWLNLVD